MSMSLPLAGRARIRNPALAGLVFLIGDWETVGTHPQVPGKALLGRTSFAWHEGGGFVIMRMQVDAPDFPHGVAIFSTDTGEDRVVLSWFDERGTSRHYAVTIADLQVSWHRDDPEIAQTIVITADGPDRLLSIGRRSERGGDWTDDLSQTFERAAMA